LTVSAASGVLTSDTLNGAVINSHTNPGHGRLALSATGAFTYIPARGFIGVDSFIYTLKNTYDSSSALVTIDVPARASISVSLSAPPSVTIGATFTYVIAVTNGGPDPASGVSVFFNVPPSLNVVSSSPPTSYFAGELNWTVASLAADTIATFDVTVQVTRGAPPTLRAFALVLSTQSLNLDYWNSTAVASTQVEPERR
jgi:uncharacterized repeat protein (TIGR01451 family)